MTYKRTSNRTGQGWITLSLKHSCATMNPKHYLSNMLCFL